MELIKGVRTACLSAGLGIILLAGCSVIPTSPVIGWNENITIDKNTVSSTGVNPYFNLTPGYQLVFEDKHKVHLTITVLAETKIVDGVETRVVEERETEDGKLTEISRNYYAISRKDNTVYYFGEDVDNYSEEGTVSSHAGAWQAGVNGAKVGIMMPGVLKPGLKYYQEIAPPVAQDRAEIVSINSSLEVPAGKFDKVLKTEETSPLEPKSREYKFYAPGIGLIKDGGLELIKHGKE